MKNLKKKLAVFATAAMLSLGGSALAMQGTEKFNLKPAEEITEQTELPESVKRANLFSIFRDFEEGRGDLERVFYGTTAKENLVISMAVYKDKTMEIGEKNNYVVGIAVHDSSLSDEKVKYIALDNFEITVDYQTFIKELEEIEYFQREWGGGRTFGVRVFDNEKDVGEDEIASDAIYGGVRYMDQENNKMEDLVYVVKLENGELVSFKGYGNGKIILQDTDGDQILGLDKQN